MAHDCPATSCPVSVTTSKLMCPQHWRMVPADLQQNLYAAWRGGRGFGTAEHYDAMVAAIRSVNNQLAGRTSPRPGTV